MKYQLHEINFTIREDKVKKADLEQFNKVIMSVDTAVKETNKR